MLRTPQEVFDKVALHLITQNKKSMSGGDSFPCMYRGENGLSCAVGCLIKNEYYDPRIEDKRVSNRDVLSVLGHSVDVSNKTIIDLLSQLQLIHDNKHVSDWRYELRELAKKNELKIQPFLKINPFPDLLWSNF